MNLEPCDVVLNCPGLKDTLDVFNIDLDPEKYVDHSRPQLDIGAER